MLNDGQAGGHFKAFLGQGTAVDVKGSFTNIQFSSCDDPLKAKMLVLPFIIRANSKLPYVWAFVDAPAPYGPGDIDVSSLALNGVPASGPGKVFWHILKVKFDRSDLVETLPLNQWTPVILTGKVGDDCLEAKGLVKVKGNRIHKPAANTVIAAGTQTDVEWEIPEDVEATNISLLSTFDDGETWNVEASNLSNTGSYRWTVPNVTAPRARLALSVMVEEDETGPVNEVEVAESEDFTISSPLSVGNGQAEFALHGAVPNPGRGLNVSFSLATNEPATLAAFDVSGRLVSERKVGAMGAGRHTVSLARPGQLPIGVYMVQLTHGSRQLKSRAVVIE
jgi:hypothetical protein